MRTNYQIAWMFFLSALCSCGDETKVSVSNRKDTAVIETKPGIEVTPKRQQVSNVLMKNEVKHLFSDTENADLFQIILTGDAVLSAKVQFNIISSRGDTLHAESFPANYLIGYALDWETSPDNEKVAFIKKRVMNFFSEDQFLNPAIKPGEKFNDDYADRQSWEEVKGDRTAIGYQYLVGEEDTKRIAWSKKRKKIVIYYNCC